MFKPVEQQTLIGYTKQTLTKWNTEEFDSAYDFNAPWELCKYIQSCVKYGFTKGSVASTCGFCPMYYYGYLFVCTTLATFPYKNQEISHRTFPNISNLVSTAFEHLLLQLSDIDNYTEYNKFVISKKLGITNSKVISNSYSPTVRKQKKYKLKSRE